VTDISAAHHSDHSLAAIKCPGHLSYWTAASARTHAGNGMKFDTLENQQLHCTGYSDCRTEQCSSDHAPRAKMIQVAAVQQLVTASGTQIINTVMKIKHAAMTAYCS